MNNKIISNVEYIIKHFGDRIKSDMHLILVYWQRIDQVNMDKKSISTEDFLNKATNPTDIVSAKVMLECVNDNN